MIDQAIQNLKTTTFCGKRFTRNQLADIKTTVKLFSSLSRRELAHTICEHHQWFTHNGENRVHLCLNVLEKLESLKIITLPAKVECKKRKSQKQIVLTDKTTKQEQIDCSLQDLLPLQLQVVIEKPEREEWNELIERYHYLGYKRPIGPHLRYYVVDRAGRKLGCLLFSFASTTLRCRDDWIGWEAKHREKQLHLVLNNNRFLLFPWVNVKYLASKVLSMATSQVCKDWQTHHGYRPVLLETFVDPTRYKGTCYQASNWQCIGKSAGRREKAPKDVYVYPLQTNFKKILLNHKSKSKNKSLKRQKTNTKLTSNDPFITLWCNIIELITQVANEFDEQWQKRRRVINTLLIILFIFRLVFSKNTQGYGVTITELWDQCRILEVPLPQAKPVAASAFCAARAKLDESIFKQLNLKIIQAYQAIQADEQWRQHRIFAVDGTLMNLPLQLKKFGYSPSCNHAYYPQGLVSCLYQLKSKIPVDFDLVAHKNERTAALSHLPCLEKNDVVVYDRGYFSYEMLYKHIEKQVHVVFRLRNNLLSVIDEFASSQDNDREVTIELSPKRQREISNQYPEITYLPLRFRLIKYVIGDTTFLLGTTLFDKQQYPRDELIELYNLRWQIEELYKVSKILIDVVDFHGKTLRGVKQELFAHFVLITLSRIFADKTEDGLHQNENCEPNKKFKVNFKNTLVTIARSLECLFLQKVTLVTNTINTIISSIANCRQKERPNRSYKRVSRKPRAGWRPCKSKKAKQINIAMA